MTCDYAATDTDCTTSSQNCIAGACRTPVSVGFCRLQYPDTITDVATGKVTTYGRVYVAGVTDQTTQTDADPRVVAQVGYGDTGTTPDTWSAWTDAAPNSAYDGATSGEANNDEYQADLTLPAAPGQSFDTAYRFSGDGGLTWTYCDAGNSGSSDGFNTPGAMTVEGAYFSEYIEGSGNNKAVEIANPGSSAFDLTGCEVQVYANGASTSNHIDISAAGSIAAGGVYVVCNTGYVLSDAAKCDLTTGSANWNGDDAVALACNGVTYDVIGQIGTDPGTNWGSGLTSTLDHTLLRECTQTVGDLDGSDAFDPSVEWAGYAKDTSYLGAVNCPLP